MPTSTATMLLLATLAATGSAACLNAEVTTCADGRTCPAGQACDDAHATCVPPDHLTACAGQPQLAPCVTADIDVGVCREGACFARACGNAVLDPDEACDDGNLDNGDGCRADCASDERCGNGVLDLGEACDEGDALAHDGCDSTCQVEVPTWSRVTQLAVAPTMAGAAVAYDVDRARLVTFGGDGGGTGGTTREWDGRAWLEHAVDDGPERRLFAAMAYDAERHEAVLFGGTGTLGPLADTWTWDGARWTQRLGDAPRPRFGHVMAYDDAHRRVILFGGHGDVSLGDTWAWDGARWAQLLGADGPSPRAFAAAAYDPGRAEIILHGGLDLAEDEARADETWRWDGTAWARAAAGAGPAPRWFAAMSYAPSAGALILTGGTADDGGAIWWWDGTAWAVDPTTALTPRLRHASFFDPRRGATILVGGIVADLASNEMLADQRGEGPGWTPVTTSPPPPPAAYLGLVYDAARGRLVRFGGLTLTASAQTWEFDGASWAQQTPPTAPSARFAPAMAYDAKRAVVVMFGGQTSHDALADDAVHEWDGATWTERTRGAGPWPTARARAAMTYDHAREGVVLFGGRDASGVRADTWRWDGATWLVESGGVAPPARAGHQLAYDRRRDVVVLVGGTAATDVWEWDGAWREIVVTGDAPVGRADLGLAYDLHLGEVVLHGGEDASGTLLRDTWRWDGERWRRVDATGGPAVTDRSSLAYDPALAATVIAAPHRTWRLRWASRAVEDVCVAAIELDGDGLAGCADPDCWAACAPACPPEVSCAAGPTTPDPT